MDKRFLAVCIMTYEHPQVVNKLIRYWAPMADELGFDIYYFDSSRDNNTAEIVNEYRSNGHIFYKKIDSDMAPDYKFLLPFDRSNLPYEYKYLWPLKDRLVPDTSFMINIYKKLFEELDVLEISYNYLNNIFKEKDENENLSKEAFYSKYAWLATDFFTTIYNYDTLLAGFNQNEITDRYFFEKSNGQQCFFPHTATLFHYLSKLNNPKIGILNLENGQNTIYSEYAKSGWSDSNIGINIFGNYWPRVNYALPSIYNRYKRDAIRKETNFAVLFGTIDGLISLRFYEEDSHRYSDHMLSSWEDFSDIPVETAKDIANGDFTSAYTDFVIKFESYVQNRQLDELAYLCHFNSWIKTNTPFCNNNTVGEVFNDAQTYFKNRLSQDNGKYFV